MEQYSNKTTDELGESILGEIEYHVRDTLETLQRSSNVLNLKDATSGGGGGVGLQVVCKDVVRLSVGGGGGQGVSLNQKKPDGPVDTLSFGGGRGAGFQLFFCGWQKVAVIWRRRRRWC